MKKVPHILYETIFKYFVSESKRISNWRSFYTLGSIQYQAIN